MTKAKNPGVNAGKLICRYEYTEWVDAAGHLYIKAEGIEWERATDITYLLAARRRAERWLIRRGLDHRWAHGNLEVWDTAYDWADGLPRAVTFKSKVPLPVEVEDEVEAQQVA